MNKYEHANRGHKLMPADVVAALKKTPLYSQDDKSAEDTPVIVKFFSPYSNWTWYVTEGNQEEDGDWTFFGLVDGHEKELGYFVLSELASLTKMGGQLPLVERDCHFGEHNLAEFTP